MGQAEQEKEQESQSLEELFRELEELIGSDAGGNICVV